MSVSGVRELDWWEQVHISSAKKEISKSTLGPLNHGIGLAVGA